MTNFYCLKKKAEHDVNSITCTSLKRENPCLSLLSTVFTSDQRSMTFKPTAVRMMTIAAVTIVVALMLQPDLFGLIPNGLDPMFYLGYEINLSDALESAGNNHYFVSRWTSYLPGHFASLIFGPYWGRLMLRLVMVSVLSETIWRFLSGMNIRAHARLISIFLLVTSPLFVRAFTTDYPEYFIIWASLIMTVWSFTEKPTLRRSATLGALAASLAIANPTAMILSCLILVNYFFDEICAHHIRNIRNQCIVALISFCATFLAGYAIFRFMYGVANIYQPTWDFIRDYVKPELDGWRTPTKEWVFYFGWLYLPFLYSVAALSVSKSMKTNVRATLLRCTSLTLLILTVHIYLEMKNGHALETSYYWSMLLAPPLIVLVVIVGSTLNSLRVWHSLALLAVVLCIYRFRIPQITRLPSGLPLLIGIALFVLALILLSKHAKITFMYFLVLISIWLQVGSPNYAIRTNAGDLNSPRYDIVYGQNSSVSNQVLRETIWFIDQMDRIPSDSLSTFVSAGGWSNAIVGTYVPHPFGRAIDPSPREVLFDQDTGDEFLFGNRKSLVIYGTPVEVEKMIQKVNNQIPDISVIRDVTHSGGLFYRLIALSVDQSREVTSIMPMNRFFHEIGELQIDGSLQVKKGTAPGWVSFGPYLGLGVGEYTAEIQFSSAQSDLIGTFEVVNDSVGKSYSLQLSNRKGELTSGSLRFSVSADDETWQFRTRYTGNLDVSFKIIKLIKTK